MRAILIAAAFMGDLYARGHGVVRDLVRAHLWLNLAAARLARGWRPAAE